MLCLQESQRDLACCDVFVENVHSGANTLHVCPKHHTCCHSSHTCCRDNCVWESRGASVMTPACPNPVRKLIHYDINNRISNRISIIIVVNFSIMIIIIIITIVGISSSNDTRYDVEVTKESGTILSLRPQSLTQQTSAEARRARESARSAI